MGVVLWTTYHEYTITELLAIATILYLTYLLALALYNISPLHPLYSYPGPLLSRASRLPILLTKWRGTEPSDLHTLHTTYGPVVRFAPNALSFTSSAAWRDIYGLQREQQPVSSPHGPTTSNGKQSYTFHKDPYHYGPAEDGKSSIITTTDEAHKRVRRILGQGFSERALRSQEGLLHKWADMLVSKLRERCAGSEKDGGEGLAGEAVVDMVSWYNFTTFDIMADLTFAEPLHMLEGSSYSPWVKKIFGTIKIAARLRVISEFPIIGWLLPTLLKPFVGKKKREHESYVTERVDRRMAKEDTAHPDLWSHILRRNEQTEGRLSQEEMYSNASMFMIAGTETTATLLSGSTYLLLRYPDTLSTLTSLIRSTFPSPSSFSLDALAHLPLLTAVLDESMRCYPPVPTGLPRIVPHGGASIAGTWVPAGTVVQVDHWSSYHSADNFQEPASFKPERWLPNAPEVYEGDDRAAFNPFSYGPRNCLGKNLAYHEARLLLAKVLWNFDLELMDKEHVWTNQGVFFLWDKPELRVRLKPAQ